MSSLIWPPKIYRHVLPVLFAGLGVISTSFGDDTTAFRETLQAEGLTDEQSRQVTKSVRRAYPVQYVSDYIKWLKGQGITDAQELTRVLPVLLPRPVDDSLEEKLKWLRDRGIKHIGELLGSYPKFFRLPFARGRLDKRFDELNKYWGIGIAEIENSPELLEAEVTRLMGLRHLLDRIAQTAGDSHFDLKALAYDQRRNLIRTGSSRRIFDYLKEIKAIARNRVRADQATLSERKILAELYRTRKIEELFPDGFGETNISALKRDGVLRYVQDLKKVYELNSQIHPTSNDLMALLKTEGFAYIERRRLMDDREVSRYSEKYIKNYLDWLKAQGLTTTEQLTIALPGIVGQPIESGLEFKKKWFKSQGVEDFRKILVSYPEMFRFSIEGNIEPKLVWLKSLGVKEIGKFISDSPEVLSHSIDDLKVKGAWLKEQGVNDFGKILKILPELFQLSLDDNLKPKVAWLKSQGVKDTGKLLTSCPAILTQPVKNLNEKVAWLKSQGVQDMGKLLSTNPQVLTHSIEDNLKPKVAWLKSHGVQDIGKLINSMPAVLGYSIEDGFERKAAWLKGQGVADVGKLLNSFPQVLSYSIEDNLEKKVAFLKGQGVKNVGKLISDFPMVLGLSLEENLVPKMIWLKRQGFKDVGQMISAFPAVLGYSIETNLEPKLIELEKYWSIGIAEIENNPMNLMGSLSKMQAARSFLDEISKMAGDSRFDLASLSSEQIRVVSQTLTPDDLFERLKQVGAIDYKRKSLTELTSDERSRVVELYRERELFGKLFLRKLSPRSLKKVSCFIEVMQNKLPNL